MGDLAGLRPSLRRADRRGDAIRRLNVGEAEGVFRLRHGDVEQEVGAAVHEHGQQREFLGHRTKRGGIAARDDAGKKVDLAFEFHAPQLFDIGVGAGGFVRGDGLDLALAEKTALSVDFLGGHDVALQGRIAEHRGRTGEEGHVAGLVRRVGNFALGGLVRGFDRLRRHHAGSGNAGAADGYAECAEKFTTINGGWLVHEDLPD